MVAAWAQLKAGKALLSLIQDPNRTEEIFKIAEIGLKAKNSVFHKDILDHAMADEGFRRLLAERYLAPKLNFDELVRMPEHTLGYAYGRHMVDNGLGADFFPRFDVTEPIRYLSIRARESHDLWHVLSGYPVGVKGELALQGFTLSQLRAPLAATIICGGLLHVVKTDATQTSDVFDAVVEGYLRGRQAKFLLGFPFEKMLELPLLEARELAGIRFT